VRGAAFAAGRPSFWEGGCGGASPPVRRPEMSGKKVRDLMVPLSDYAVVPEDATLYDAVVALEDALKRRAGQRYAHRAVLVRSPAGEVVGKVSLMDIIRSLEPRYNQLPDSRLSRAGASASFVRSIMKSQGLWQEPLDDLARKASRTKVRDVMYTPAEGEYVEDDSSLDEGIHRLIAGKHQSLLVTRGGKVVGVLRLADVFAEVSALIKASRS